MDIKLIYRGRKLVCFAWELACKFSDAQILCFINKFAAPFRITLQMLSFQLFLFKKKNASFLLFNAYAFRSFSCLTIESVIICLIEVNRQIEIVGTDN